MPLLIVSLFTKDAGGAEVGRPAEGTGVGNMGVGVRLAVASRGVPRAWLAVML